MQQVGIVLYLFLGPEVFVHQVIILADDFEAVFFFLGNVQPLAGNTRALDNETFEQDAEHFFLKVVRHGELTVQQSHYVFHRPPFRFVEHETNDMRRTVEQESAA